MNESEDSIPASLADGDDGFRPSGRELLHDNREGPYVFPHPQWTVGVILILAMAMLFLGIFGHPLWFLIGSPFIATFFVWLVVRITQWRRPDIVADDDEG